MKTPQRTAQRAPAREPAREEGWPENFEFYEPSTDKFYIDPASIPDGMDYEFHAISILGKENTQQLINWERNRWTPVPADRHPEIGGEPVDEKSRYARSGGIVIEGQMLFERPKAITNEARRRERGAANDQLRNQIERLKLAPEGTLSDKGTRNVNVKHEYERITPPQAVEEDA